MTTKRLYVDGSEFPGTLEWRTVYPYDGCEQKKGLFEDYTGFNNGTNTVDRDIVQSENIPTTQITEENPVTHESKVIGYYYTARLCADCTVRGSNTKPAFWTDK